VRTSKPAGPGGRFEKGFSVAVFKRSSKAVCKKTGKTVRRKSRCYYGKVKEADGKVSRVKLCPDKAVSERMLNELKERAWLEKAGLPVKFRDEAGRALSEHIADFRRSLEAENDSAKHVGLTVGRLEKIVAGCEFGRLSDLSASRLADWLATRRDADVDSLSISTSNKYLGAAKQFGAWLVQDVRSPANPFAHLAALNMEADIRRERRAARCDEFALLLEAACNGETIARLTGADREILYLVAAYTGLRASELASLTAQSFDLDSDRPTLTVEAGYSKHRRRDILPLDPDIAARVRRWLSEKTAALRNEQTGAVRSRATAEPSGRLWPGKWANKAAKMLRCDLAAARWAWIAAAGNDDGETQRRIVSGALRPVDAKGCVLDFHGLRHTFITNLALAGVHPKEAQVLARHSTIGLTMDLYTHLHLVDVAGALDKLPRPPDSRSDAPVAMPLQATGTDGNSLAQKLAHAETNWPQNRPALTASQPSLVASRCTETNTPNSNAVEELGASVSSFPAENSKRRRSESNRRWRICNPLP